MKEEIQHSIDHVGETNGVRKVFWRMDEKLDGLLYGIRQGDDSVVVGDLVVNMEGPYPMKIGRKTGLIHTCCDIVVMGARPLFGLNSMQVSSIEEAVEAAEDLRKQSDGLGVPMIGGNTQMEKDLVSCVSFTVVGKIIKTPIPDGGGLEGDRILMLGEIMDGDIGERVYRAKTKFETFIGLIESGVDVHAAKDASRGGWFGNLTEMLIKARLGCQINSIPYPRLTRYMGSYLVMVPESEVKRVVDIAVKHKCPVIEIGFTTKELGINIGGESVVSGEKMRELIEKFPYKKPYGREFQ